ncbi:ROK family protein [Hathewaya limosa]|uniref:Glucokinase n=1 Tax=Hathewaya limosa TaxID=1536 RepID=A0ABU0JUN4_HATLI|nr:ROK family protein [Hathewaya limosa]MDQ0480812.1 glucokinase [Hathewaya limosa]
MYIGIDLGGTNIAAGIVEENGNIILKDYCKTRIEAGSKSIINDIKNLINNLIKKGGVKKSDFKAIGIGIPGVANKEGIVIRCINLKWRMVPLKKPLEEYFRIPVFIDNDATVAGIAEYAQGALKGYNNGLLLTLGTGIGAGIIIEGKPFSGGHGIGSEIGHMVVGENFYTCNCGLNGCIETFSSATGIIKYAEKLLNDGMKSLYLEEQIKENNGTLNAKIILAGLYVEDELCMTVYKRFLKYLVLALRNIINIIDPEVIAFGGGISNMGEKLIIDIRKELEKGYNKDLPIPRLVLAKTKNDAGIIGAALLGKF